MKTYSSRSLLCTCKFTMVLVSRKLIPNPGTAIPDMTYNVFGGTLNLAQRNHGTAK